MPYHYSINSNQPIQRSKITHMTNSIPPILIETLRNAQHIVVLTGAGTSAESGVPTFRDAQTGLWAQYDPEELATPEAFQRNPKLVWEWYSWRRDLVAKQSLTPATMPWLRWLNTPPNLPSSPKTSITSTNKPVASRSSTCTGISNKSKGSPAAASTQLARFPRHPTPRPPKWRTDAPRCRLVR